MRPALTDLRREGEVVVQELSELHDHARQGRELDVLARVDLVAHVARVRELALVAPDEELGRVAHRVKGVWKRESFTVSKI